MRDSDQVFSGTRDIPSKAVLHQSLLTRLLEEKYRPRNNHGGAEASCLQGSEAAKRSYYVTCEEDGSEQGDHTL